VIVAVRYRTFLWVTLALAIVALPVGARASAATAMAPLSQYLMDRQAEIELARSAAPASISGHAAVLVLTPHGYETAAAGTNGFTCVVERSWTKSFDDVQFWNAKVRAPVCYNPAASRSVLPYTLFRTKLALGGASESTIHSRLESAIGDKQLPSTEAGSMAYMMSISQYIDDFVKAWYPHIMIYTPKADGAKDGESWGADRKGSPVVYDSSHLINPEPWAIFFVPVPEWSNGSWEKYS
jgi:hypothetical protein